MISTWYFCCCTGMQPKVTQAFMTAVEALADPRSDADLVRLSIGEILKGEQIARQYAVPALIASGLMESRSEPELLAAHQGAVDDALAVLDGTLARHLVAAWAVLREQTGARAADGVVARLREALERCASLRSWTVEIEPAPYLHTGEFLAESTILSLVVQAARMHTDTVNRFAGDDAFVVLIKDALNSLYGRMAMLLAAEAATLLGEEVASADFIQRHLLEAPRTAAHWEPDVLACLARLSFTYPGAGSLAESPQSAGRRILLESITFTALSSLRTKGKPQTAPDAVGRLGLVGQPDELTTLVLWQAVLQELAAQIDPVEAAEQLRRHWIPPHRPITAPVKVAVPVRPDALRGWQRRATLLAGLRARPAEPIRFQPRSGSFRDAGWVAVAMLSPWLTRQDRAERDQSPFDRITDGLVLLRLLLAATTAGSLLRHQSGSGRDELIALTLHAGDVLADRVHAGHLDALWFEREGAAAESMSPPLSGLALYVRRLIRRLGSGAHAEVDPVWYAEYLAREADETTPDQERRLLNGPGQEVATAWIQDALSGSLPDAVELQGRWRSGPQGGRGPAQVTLQQMVERGGAGRIHRPAALLAVHFGEYSRRAQQLAWYNNPERFTPNIWRALAAERLSTERWTTLPIKAEPGSDGHLATLSARLCAVLEEGRTADPAFVPWVDQWRKAIRAVDEPMDFARALRVFLLELLTLPLTGTPTERQVLEDLIDAEVEFGFGTPLDRWLLFTRLGANPALSEELAHPLRMRMLSGVYRRAGAPARRSRMTDPWSARESLHNDELLARLLERFVFELNGRRSRVQRDTVEEVVPRMWRDAHALPVLREVRIDLDPVQPRTAPTALDRRLLMGVAVDSTTDVARLHLARRPRLTGVVDTFGMSTEDAADALKAARGSALGVVAAADRDHAWVNIGTGAAVQARAVTGVDVGDLVVVDVGVSARGDLQPVDGGHLRRPETEPEIGDLRPARVTLSRRDGIPEITVTPEGEPPTVLGSGSHSEAYRRAWAPDLTGMMTGQDGGPDRPQVYDAPLGARWNGEEWLPADQGLAEFLALVSSDVDPVDGAQPLRLVVVDAPDTQSLRFSVAPGSTVVIPHRAWDPQSRDRLLHELAVAGRETTGTVILAAVRPDDKGRPSLVVKEPEAGDPPAFDRRAALWRGQFQEGEYEARWSAERRRYEYDPGHELDGFPAIHVDVNATGQWIRFVARRWDASHHWRARVEGDVADQRNLALQRRDRKTFDAITDLKPGDTLTLKSTLRRAPMFGLLRGWTTTELQVEVEPESLTLAPVDQNTPRKMLNGRVVEVTAPPRLLTPKKPQPPRAIPDAVLLEAIDPAERGAAEDHLIRTRRLTGIVVGSPVANREDPDDHLRVWLDLGETIAECQLRRGDLDNAAVGVGAIVTGERSAAGGWEFHARTRIIQVRARWTLHETPPPEDVDALFLGVVTWRGERRAVSQLVSYPDVYVYSMAQDEPGHLAQRSRRQQQARGHEHRRHGEDRWRSAAIDWARARVDVTRARSNGLTRVVVNTGGREEQLYPGVVERPVRDLDVAVAGVDVELHLVAAGHVVVERIFRLTRTRPPAVDRATDDEPDGFRAYLAGPRRPILADLRGQLVRLRVPWKVPVKGGPSSTVPLADGEEPWVEERYTSEAVRVVLEETKDGWEASYRRVPTLDLGESVPELQRQGLVVGAMSRLRQPLRYVERREVASEIVHRFEWGYGWTLAVPESLLLVAGREADSWPIAPFHGDAVSEVCVGQLPDGRWTMDINRVGVAFGWRNELYQDCLKGLVTTAEIDAGGGGSARIQALQVRWRRDTGTEDGRYRDDRRRSVRQAQLHPDAARALGEALAGHTGDDTPRALLRLRLEDFRRSGGNVLRFDYVRPILGAEGGLTKGMYVFLEAQEIEQLPNDVRLRLSPGRLLGARPEGFTLQVRRRDFSARQELLRQINQGGQRVAGDVYLVRVGDVGRHGDSGDGQIRDGLTRPLSTLRSYLNSGHSVQGVVEPRKNGGYALELRPNVLFLLAAADVDAPARLARGTFVRVSLSAGRISLTPTLRGDHAYLASDWHRPAILLPMQDLFRRQDTLAEALARGNYSLAGLPAVIAPAIPDQPSRAETEFAEGLLTRDHPKVAMVRCTQQGWVQDLVPLDGSAHAGVLLVGSEGTLRAREPGGGEPVRVSWSQVSFLDAGRTELRARCTGSWWQYHDDTTARREDRAPYRPMQPKPLPERATATGEPVFFSADWSLRHAAHLRRFGYPATDLIEGTQGRGGSKSLTLPVAGVAVSAHGQSEGLWVELAPGRVIEVIGSMMTTADGVPTWLDHMAWDHFAPGDLVDLRVDRGHRLDIGALALRRWRPGPRGGWGKRVLLPILAVDIDSGVLALGGGQSTVRWPMEPDGPAFNVGALVWLDDRNRVEPILGDPHPATGDTVLVHVVDGELRLMGDSRFECRVDGSDRSWTTAALAAGGYELVKLTGGCLLMTVENSEGHTLFLSRSLQRDGDLPIERVVPGLALGRLGDVVVFASGARLHRCPVADVVPGIPEAILPVALDRLASFPAMQWLRGRPGHLAAVGLPGQAAETAATKELRAAVVCVLGEGDDLGVLLWDVVARRPRWLPAGEAGWLTPTYDELTAAFGDGGGRKRRRVIRVVEQRDGSVSIIRTAPNQQLLRQLKVGDPVRVTTLPTPGREVEGDRYEYAARVYLSDVLVRFQTRSSTPAPAPGVPKWCEIEEKRRDRGHILVGLCESGIREVAMAVPPLADVRRVEDLAMADHYLLVREGQATVVAAADAVAVDPSAVQVALPPLRDWLAERGPALFGPESRDTLDLVPALSVCALLAQLGAAGDDVAASAAVHVARQIGLRATASQHLEPLIRLWSNAENRASDPQMWRRLGKIEFGTRIPAAAVDRIRTVDDAFRHRSVRINAEVLLASACVAASVGTHAGYDEIASGSSVLSALAGLGRALVPRSATALAQNALLPAQLGILHDLRRKAQVGPQLVLLPVPTFLQDPECPRAAGLLGRLMEGGDTVAALDVGATAGINEPQTRPI